MSRTLQVLGTVVFWATWPLWYFAVRGSLRARSLVEHDGKILVVRSWIGAGHWSFPGGGLHRGEDARIGMARELAEETGLLVPPGQLIDLGMADYRQYGLRYRYHAFGVRLDKRPRLKLQRLEIAAADWLPSEQLLRADVEKEVVTIFKRWQKTRA